MFLKIYKFLRDFVCYLLWFISRLIIYIIGISFMFGLSMLSLNIIMLFVSVFHLKN